MFVIIGIRCIKPEHVDDYVRHIEEMTALSLSEPGCLRYDVLRDNDDPTVFHRYECFVDEAAARAHQAAPYHEQSRAITEAWYDGPRLGRWEATSVGA